jgi:hypothetical protein
MKYRGKRIDNGELVYGYPYQATDWARGHNEIDQIVDDMGCHHDVEDFISIFFGKKDKNGKEIYTNDKVKYKGKEYEVRYFEEYGAFGLYDEKHNRPLGRSGSSTKYEPYFMNDYHTRQMELL